MLFQCHQESAQFSIVLVHCIVKRAEKIIFSLVFVCSPFTEISYFLSFPSNENVRKQHLSANVYFCINMKFSYTRPRRKDEVTKTRDFLLVFRSTLCRRYLSEKIKLSVVLQGKQAIFQLSVDDIHIFMTISFRKRDRTIVDLFFFSFKVMKARSLYLTS